MNLFKLVAREAIIFSRN